MTIYQHIPFFILSLMVIIVVISFIRKNPKLLTILVLSSLGFYLICVFWLIFTPGIYYLGESYFMRYFWFKTAKIVYIPAGITSEGSIMNMVMTIPAGVYLRLLLPKKINNLAIIILLAIMIGIFNEGGQFVFDILVNIQRTVDITDVITNSIGVIVGWLAITLFQIKPVDLKL